MFNLLLYFGASNFKKILWFSPDHTTGRIVLAIDEIKGPGLGLTVRLK